MRSGILLDSLLLELFERLWRAKVHELHLLLIHAALKVCVYVHLRDYGFVEPSCSQTSKQFVNAVVGKLVVFKYLHNWNGKSTNRYGH